MIFVTSIKTAEEKPRLGVVECSALVFHSMSESSLTWTFIFQNNPV